MDFFLLKHETSSYFCPVNPQTKGEAPKCLVCQECVGMIPTKPPVFVKLEVSVKNVGDFIFGPANQILVSERFKSIYTREQLTGIEEFVPVEVKSFKWIWGRKRPKPVLPPYYLITPGRAARLDVKASGLNDTPSCQACLSSRFSLIERIAIEPGSWKGDDIFILWGLPGLFITSSKFKDLCVKEGISNANFLPADQYSYDRRYLFGVPKG